MILFLFLTCNIFAINKTYIAADSILFDSLTQDMVVSNNVVINHHDLEILTQNAIFKKKKGQILFNNKVVINRLNPSIVLSSDKLRISVAKKIVEAFENVRLLYKNYKVSSDFAVFNIQKGKIILSGRLNIIRGKNKIQTKKMILNYKRKTVEFRGKTAISVIKVSQK